MAIFGGNDYTGFKAVNLKGSGGIRMGGFDANVGTIYFAPASLESTRAWGLPDKSGTMPISGTFAVQIPAIAATTFSQSTVATVVGIRAEDGLTVVNQTPLASAYGTASTARILFSAVPGNGNITLSFVNIGAATGYTEHVFGFTAVR